MPGATACVRLWAASTAGAMMESRKAAGRRMSRSSSDGDALEDGFEERESVGGAEQWIDGPLRMGHHAEHVAPLTHDTRDVVHRAIRVVRLLRFEVAGRVAEHPPALALQPLEGLVVGAVASVAMRDREEDALATLVA